MGQPERDLVTNLAVLERLPKRRRQRDMSGVDVHHLGEDQGVTVRVLGVEIEHHDFRAEPDAVARRRDRGKLLDLGHALVQLAQPHLHELLPFGVVNAAANVGGLAALSDQAADRTAILLVERHQEAKAVTQQGQWSRRADLYLYNYDTDTLTRLLVNLESGAVETVESAQNVQLPLTPTETERAIQLVLADPQARTVLSGQYQSTSGRPLTNPRQQLDFHLLIFRAETMSAYSLGRAVECGYHRCAQLLITALDGYLFDLLPIVDLSRNEVVIANDK